MQGVVRADDLPKLLGWQPQQLRQVLVYRMDDLLCLDIRQVQIVLAEEGDEPQRATLHSRAVAAVSGREQQRGCSWPMEL